MLIESYEQNNITQSLAHEELNAPFEGNYWMGLKTLNDLSTNTLETASNKHVSLYSGRLYWVFLIHNYLPISPSITTHDL